MISNQKQEEKVVEVYRVSQSEIESLRVPPGSRQVLIRIDSRNIDERTPSGIWTVTDTDWQPAVHSDRTGTVIAVPKDPLPFNQIKGQDIMPWKTKVEISPGMKVWFDYLASENCVTYIDETETHYKLINYDDLYVATINNKSGSRIVPLNGFHLFEIVYKEKTSEFDTSDPKINTREGIVKYVAKNNELYTTEGEEDLVNLQTGDRVRFGPVPAVYLEDEAHCTFDGGTMYRRAQARNIDLVWRGDELILPRGKLLIKQIPEKDHYRGNLILPPKYVNKRSDIKNHRGEVLVSSVHEAPPGAVVKYIIGAGALIDYKGDKCRVLKSAEILYVE